MSKARFLIVLFTLFFFAAACTAQEEAVAVLAKGVTFAPLQAVAKDLSINCQVKSSSATVTHDEGSYCFTAGSKKVVLDDMIEKPLPQMPFQRGDQLMVPARALALCLGLEMYVEKGTLYFLDKKTKTILSFPVIQEKWFEIVVEEQRIYRYESCFLIDSSRCCTGRTWSGKGWMKYHPLYYIRKKEGAGARSKILHKYNVATPWKLYLTLYGPNEKVNLHSYHDVRAYPYSKGCLRLYESYAKLIYPWAEIGMPVAIRLKHTGVMPKFKPRKTEKVRPLPPDKEAAGF